jgi:hypothetical protein
VPRREAWRTASETVNFLINDQEILAKGLEWDVAERVLTEEKAAYIGCLHMRNHSLRVTLWESLSACDMLLLKACAVRKHMLLTIMHGSATMAK